MIRPTHAYIGRCPKCKAATSSVYDLVSDKRFTGKEVAAMMKRGLEVERVPLGSVEISADGCQCVFTYTHAYIGRCAGCSAIRAFSVDEPGRKETAKHVAEMVQDGLLVERVEITPDLRMGPCTCKSEAQPESLTLPLFSEVTP